MTETVYQCPQCGAEQPDPGKCGRCPGTVAPKAPEPACDLCGKPAHERDRVDDGRHICDNCLRGTATR